MKTVLKIALGIILGLTVLIVGCSALFSAGVDEAQKKSDKTAITSQDYSATKTGDLRRDVEARLGKPSSSNESSSEIEGLDEPVGSRCVYYNREGEIASLFQFCFDINTDKLESKSSF